MRKFFVSLAAAGAVLLGAHPAAADTPYLQVFPTTAGVGQRVTAYGSGFCSVGCSSVTLAVGNQVVASGVQVATDGRFQATFTPNLTPGTYEVSARQTGPGGSTSSASASLQIAASDSGTSPTPGTSPGTATPVPSATAGASPSQKVPNDARVGGLAPIWVAIIVIGVIVLLAFAAELAVRRSRRKK
jgi:hypothetical protein